MILHKITASWLEARTSLTKLVKAVCNLVRRADDVGPNNAFRCPGLSPSGPADDEEENFLISALTCSSVHVA